MYICGNSTCHASRKISAPRQVFLFLSMKFEKIYSTIDDQITILKERGMFFEDEKKAKYYLSNISYYRLSAYWYTFLKQPQSDHLFHEDATFQKALDTYVFDRKLRLIVFNEIERIEIALRAQLICQYCSRYGSNWYEDKSHFKKHDYYIKFNFLLTELMNKTSEVFIRHYKKKYTEPSNPPAWMALELASFGQLSMLFKNLKNDAARKSIAEHFAIHENVLCSWFECLSYIRNNCAHHMRLWNRKLPKTPMMPSVTKNGWINTTDPEMGNRLYYSLCVIRYLLNQISPGNSFPKKVNDLLLEFPNVPQNYMGFTTEWAKEDLWK